VSHCFIHARGRTHHFLIYVQHPEGDPVPGGRTWRQQGSYNPDERTSYGLRGNTGSAVFGSSAPTRAGPRGEASDVDLRIEVDGPASPWFPGGLVADLEALLGCRVDVVESDALRPEMRERALAEAVPL